MALVVQNDDGDAVGANAYVSVADFKTYHTDRGNSYSAYTDPQIASAIIRATDYLDTRFTFIGITQTTDQTTQWPRKSQGAGSFVSTIDVDPWTVLFIDVDDNVVLVGPNGNEIVGIPEAVKRACNEYAFRALTIPLFQDAPAPAGGRLVDEHHVRVDVIMESFKYAPGQSGGFAMPAFPAADMLLVRAGLITSGKVLQR